MADKLRSETDLQSIGLTAGFQSLALFGPEFTESFIINVSIKQNPYQHNLRRDADSRRYDADSDACGYY